jgi:hypothetical protein
MENPCKGIFNYKTTKAIMVKVFIIFFGTHPRIVNKFQTNRFRNGDKNEAYRNNEMTRSKLYTLTGATLPYANVAASQTNKM